MSSIGAILKGGLFQVLGGGFDNLFWSSYRQGNILFRQIGSVTEQSTSRGVREGYSRAQRYGAFDDSRMKTGLLQLFFLDWVWTKPLPLLMASEPPPPSNSAPPPALLPDPPPRVS